MGFVNKNLQALLEESIAVGAADAIDIHIEVHDGITILNYMNAVPAFAEILLERLYGNIFSSLAHYRIYNGTMGIHTYIACKDEQVLAVLLYRTAGTHVRILNEATQFAAIEIDRFAQHVFRTYPSVNVISLHAVSLEGKTHGFPLQRFNCLEDIVLGLPSSAEEYMAGLGKSTRNYLNRYQNKLKRAFPALCYETYTRHEIQESHIHEILELNRSRMEGKGKLTPWTAIDRQRMLELARICGMVNLITIDGRICAGTINYRVNDNYFLEVIAHAPEYNDYRLGTICCFITICKCIALGGKEYHFLWGQSDYKYRLGGVQHDLEHVSIFRSRRQMLRNANLVLSNLFHCYDRKMRLWVKEMRRRDNAIMKPVESVIHSLDAIKMAWQRHKQHWLGTSSECSDSPKTKLPT
ncbi:GNAT family N-acetyltransferase [Oxalobacteraceae bacterium R-40]|uniref:GNAT family N-acetyltransferase n=1 Tax=Keguizhuia sedimenti TaxID=3064264 RepID=A0ABU1BUB3_9BURK|nr:GNAT family N-acetyltransferase [Oxalobacteraceae bacterium R-40]